MTDNSKKTLLICLLLWSFAFVLYTPSLKFGFICFDDDKILLNHPNLYNENSFAGSLEEIFVGYFPREEPLLIRDISWAVDSYVYGFRNPFGYHLGNVLLNSCNIVLLFLFLVATTRKMFFSCAVAITFGTLPVHVEPVCWIMGRKDLLVTFFMLAALISQTFYLESGDRSKRRRFYLFGILATTAALLSKINAVTFFCVLVVHNVFFSYLKVREEPAEPFYIWPILKRALWGILPHLMISVFIFFWYRNILSSWGVLSRGMDSFSIEHLSNLVIFLPLVFAYYLKLIFIPNQFSIYYPWPSINIPLSPSQVAVSILIVLVFAALVVYCFRRNKVYLFYMAVFFFLMLPYCNLQYIGIWIANRYIYLSSFCILAITADSIIHTVSKLNEKIKKISLFVWLIFVLINIVQTHRYQQVWQDDVTLWTYETNLDNPSVLSFVSLASSYIAQAKKVGHVEERARRLGMAETTIQKGLETFEGSNIEKYEPMYNGLLYLQGSVSGLIGDRLEKQVVYYLKAFSRYTGDEQVTRKIAMLYYLMAKDASDLSERKRLVDLSLSYFEKYLDIVGNDPIIVQKNLALLNKRYLDQFTFLEPRINRLKQKLN